MVYVTQFQLFKQVVAFGVLVLLCVFANAQTLSDSSFKPPKAYNLLDAWSDARASESSLLSAKAQLRLAQAQLQQTESANKPKININGGLQYAWRNYETSGGGMPRSKSHQNFPVDNARIQLTQSLFRKANRLDKQRAQRLVQQARHHVQFAEQELSNRMVGAWLDLMQARDEFELATKREGIYQKEFVKQEQAWKSGLVARPSVEKARAQWQLSVSKSEASQANIQQRKAALAELTGYEAHVPLSIATLVPESETGLEISFAKKALLRHVAETNYNIYAAKEAVAAAQAEVEKQRAARYPTLDLQASHGWNRQGAGSTPNQRGYKSNQTQVGVLLNMPIYTGGQYDAQIAQALAKLEVAEIDLSKAKRRTISTATQTWYAAKTAKQQLSAAKAQLQSVQWDIKLAQKGVAVGIKTPQDIAQSRQEQYEAQGELLQARYAFIKAWYRLQSLGTKDSNTLIKEVHGLFDYVY